MRAEPDSVEEVFFGKGINGRVKHCSKHFTVSAFMCGFLVWFPEQNHHLFSCGVHACVFFVVRLFHGSTRFDPFVICGEKDGIDPRCSGTSNYYGRGAYVFSLFLRYWDSSCVYAQRAWCACIVLALCLHVVLAGTLQRMLRT